MRTVTIIAILLIIIGVTAFGYQGFTYTTREKVIDIGSLDVSVTKKKTIPIPPIIGGIALIGGIVLMTMGRKEN
ncbi:MAG: DUF3185 domain-containing protein [Desulfobacteraceae bacterium]|jgi:hypothetical protein